MLSRIQITFNKSEELLNKYNFSGRTVKNLGIKLQAVMMGLISSDYADELHTTGVNKFQSCRPYSQYCYYNRDNCLVWVVTTTSEKAKINIINVLSNIDSIKLDKDNITLTVASIEKSSTTLQEIMDKRYLSQDNSCLIRMDFLTPTIFDRKDNEFIYMPDAYLIFKNILDRYSAMSSDFDVNTEETLNYLKTSVKILDFNIRTVRIASNEYKIPACLGNIYIKFEVTAEYGSFLKILADLSEYVGIGLQTARGMGGVKVQVINK